MTTTDTTMRPLPPLPERMGEDGEFLVIQGHHDPHEAAWAFVHGNDEGCGDAVDLVNEAGGWHAYVATVQAVHMTNHPSGEWFAFHTTPTPHSEPVTVLTLDRVPIRSEEPRWPEWLSPAHVTTEEDT